MCECCGEWLAQSTVTSTSSIEAVDPYQYMEPDRADERAAACLTGGTCSHQSPQPTVALHNAGHRL